MKRLFFPLLCMILLLPGHCRPLGALEIELTGGLNSMTFDPDRITAHGQSGDDEQFDGYSFIFGDLLVKGDISGNLRSETRLQRDNILQNVISSKLSTNMEYFNVEFGPFVGMGDKLEKPDVGVTGGIELAYPGIAFLSISGSSTLGFKFDFLGEDNRKTAEVKLGFWLPNIIAAFSVNIKNFTRQTEEAMVLRDELTRFQVSVDFHAKNSPLILRFDAGYEILSRSYNWGNNETVDKLEALFGGIEANVQIKQLRIIGGYETPIRLTVEPPMEAPANIYSSLYRLKAGVAFTFY